MKTDRSSANRPSIHARAHTRTHARKTPGTSQHGSSQHGASRQGVSQHAAKTSRTDSSGRSAKFAGTSRANKAAGMGGSGRLTGSAGSNGPNGPASPAEPDTFDNFDKFDGQSTFAKNIAKKVFTRRNFVIGGAALGVAAIAGAGVGIAKNNAKQAEREAIKQVAGDAAGTSATSGDVALLTVPESAVFTTETCEYIDNPEDILRLQTTAKLPHGTLLWASDDTVAACLLPTQTSAPLAQIGLLSLSSGNLATVVKDAVGAQDGFQIFDVRANESGLIWTESDILTGNWRVYTTPVSNMVAGTPVLAAEGEGTFEMPTLAICGRYGFWQEVPKRSAMKNVASSEIKSTLMRIPIGAEKDAAESVYQAKGYMACAPANSATGVAFAPRSATSGTYYQLTHIDAETAEVTDRLTLPASMRPTEVAYGSTGFSFSFDGIYSYGGGISNLGTYTPAAPVTLNTQEAYANACAALEEKQPTDREGEREPLNPSQEELAEQRAETAVCDLYSSSEWFRFPRTPLTSPAWCGDWFLVKSTNVVAGVDLANKRYFTLTASGNGESYGEFLASSGTTDRIVTYSNLDYTPINGEPVKECAVRVWST